MKPKPTNDEIRWNALIVKSRMEKLTGRQLSEIGLETCVPVQRQLRQWCDRQRWIDVVLFGGYVFVGLKPEQRNLVYKSPYVMKFVQFGGKVGSLTDEEVRLIKCLGDLPEPVQIENTSLPQLGEEVEIISGVLSGFKGYLLAQQGRRRISLSLNSLGCFAEVEVPAAAIRLVASG
jgi:transcriptional antiterminator RfaH